MLAAAGVLMILALFGGKLVNRVHLPSITGWVIVGLLLGPSCLRVLTPEITELLQPIEGLALAVIALAIGGELTVRSLKKLGNAIITITWVQMLVTFGLVTLGTYLACGSWALAALLGAMSAATAPAATVAVIHELKAKGPFTRTLLAVVALDDAFTIVLFGIVMSFVETALGGSALNVSSLAAPFLEILLSTLLGVGAGLLGVVVLDRLQHRTEVLPFVLGLALLVGGVAELFGLSLLLAAMVAGSVIANLGKRPRVMFEALESVEQPIYILFFSLAGAKLQLGALGAVGLLGISYVLARSFGKILGNYLGAWLAKSPEAVRKYLGYAMLPQAGVAIGLAIVAFERLPQYADVIMTTTLAAVFIYELIGPLAAKYALVKAGEVPQRAEPEVTSTP
ncbi:MAG TPA: cation:proton antiporter [Firmicutes bacterium]|nr:cation:proton antiporter [Bacillota bacterium]